MSEHNEGAPSAVPQPEEERCDQLPGDGAVLSDDVEQALHPRGLSKADLFEVTEMSMRNLGKIKKICGVERPTLEDLSTHFCEQGTNRKFSLEGKSGIGPKSKTQIIDSFLEERIILKMDDGSYEFHPRVFNSLPAEWCAVVASPEEMEAMTRVLDIDIDALSELSFMDFRRAMSSILHSTEPDALVVQALLEKSGLTNDQYARKWSPDFNREKQMEMYGPEVLQALSTTYVSSLGEGFSLGGRDPRKYFTLERVFEDVNPDSKRDMTFEQAMDLLIRARVPRENALLFLIKLAERNFSIHFGLAEGEEAKAQTELDQISANREAYRVANEQKQVARRAEAALEANNMMAQRRKAGILLQADPSAEICQEPFSEVSLQIQLWNKLAATLADFSNKKIAELTTQDLFEFFDGPRSQADKSRQAHFDLLVGIPGVAKARRRGIIRSLLEDEFFVTRADENQDHDDLLDRNYDFHPRIYKGGIGEWIAVRCDEMEFNFVADMLGMDTDTLVGLSFKDFNKILFKWRNTVKAKTADEKKRLLEILRRTGLFDRRRTDLNGAPKTWMNFDRLSAAEVPEPERPQD